MPRGRGLKKKKRAAARKKALEKHKSVTALDTQERNSNEHDEAASEQVDEQKLDPLTCAESVDSEKCNNENSSPVDEEPALDSKDKESSTTEVSEQSNADPEVPIENAFSALQINEESGDSVPDELPNAVVRARPKRATRKPGWTKDYFMY